MNHKANLPFPDERHTGRRRAHVDVAVRPLRGLPLTARLEDVNEVGCGLSGCQLGLGDEIWVQVDGHEPVRATVVWTKGHRAGCRFYTPERSLAAERGAAAVARPERMAVARPHPLRTGRS